MLTFNGDKLNEMTFQGLSIHKKNTQCLLSLKALPQKVETVTHVFIYVPTLHPNLIFQYSNSQKTKFKC